MLSDLANTEKKITTWPGVQIAPSQSGINEETVRCYRRATFTLNYARGFPASGVDCPLHTARDSMIMKICGELALVGAIASVFIVAAQGRAEERAAEEAAGREYILKLDEKVGQAKNKRALANWAYESNMTAYNEEQMMIVSLEVAEEEKENWKETMSYLWHEFEDEDLKRMFQKYTILGTSALPEDLNQRLIQAISNMQSTYAKATICDYKDRNKCDLHVEPETDRWRSLSEITNIFATSQDPEELKYAWLEWHRVAGAASKGNFTEYVQLNNEAAKLNGYDNAAEWWLSEYEASDSEVQFATLWSQVKPLYLQIHAYVRRHLRLKYGDEVVPARGPIPAHLLGNIWAQTWGNVEYFTRPHKDKPEVDVTAALIAQNYTALKMFQAAEDFFKSLNLSGMPDLFWERSIIERPDDGREMVCHASAWDFFDGEDFRIKQCTTITNAFFITTHHEMGHIQYYLQYKDQPQIYRSGANPGFHEAVGDVIALSVSTPKHLKKMGLLQEGPEDAESNINQLYKMGLDKIVFLPFAYVLDLFRYGVFRGTTTPESYNCHFWMLREALQGVQPPAPRSEYDFDPAAKYHVSADVEYMRHFALANSSKVLVMVAKSPIAIPGVRQFQFHRALCELAGEYTPGSDDLASCDIYNNAAAGSALGSMLSLGSSKPWPDAMEVLTGQRIMDASAVLDYFRPLYDWLIEENARTGEYIGWEASEVVLPLVFNSETRSDAEPQPGPSKRLTTE
ncbi:Angiotensin-converting enzyme [Eumeta japonica]|uniref:Angiotensin-converting enzyme n=1 Tax=Eumeta variegata TaxID=151549 RepID=A0A4C1TW98_EUMVA|nr:Angiotensin-converting enzyme [Eumeta japonica]